MYLIKLGLFDIGFYLLQWLAVFDKNERMLILCNIKKSV